MFLIILLTRLTKLNANINMIIKILNYVALNAKTVSAALNKQTLKKI